LPYFGPGMGAWHGCLEKRRYDRRERRGRDNFVAREAGQPDELVRRSSRTIHAGIFVAAAEHPRDSVMCAVGTVIGVRADDHDGLAGSLQGNPPPRNATFFAGKTPAVRQRFALRSANIPIGPSSGKL
jgi:hypothetical protein